MQRNLVKKLQSHHKISGICCALGLSLTLHSLLLWILVHATAAKAPLTHSKNPPIRLQLNVKTKEPAQTEKNQTQVKEKQRQSIVEAPLLPTEPPDLAAFLGAQNHRTHKERKTQPKASARAADATALQNGPLRLKIEAKLGGKIKVPATKDYQKFLPNQIDLLNAGHNDYLNDAKIPVAVVLDVNTTDFRFIGYFTAVRKLVDLAYYDISPSIRDKSYIRDKIQNRGKARLQGISKVQLKIARSGVLLESKMLQSSGDKDVDEFWTRVLNLAAPYPPLPRNFAGEELSFTYQLHYDLVFQNERQMRRFMF